VEHGWAFAFKSRPALPTIGDREQANIPVDRSAGAGWTFVQSHMANVQMKSAAEPGWAFA
jgi:hypothetical protein